ncbi:MULTISPECIES: sodium/glutamate symporter [Turicibacter]|jgi:sodium/glutamate symporter|uniref:Sodium/glutamate symporter n=3 Tax=Bacteria TaxID=2 RepID=A0A173RZG5_9FIRM|nr:MULTISPECIES: sodium/glutamate symporter [Turicibacter]EFF63060.1 sodium/glutamate symporter [Turicibacter sanguinis PC909]EGC92611.1 sodium/glutamate symporter [Turicibacter sp. HGF1]MBP3904898.1 sodium/glutamate symporter [Turicibacter sp.]MCU7190437.1 sodium/glutamate symporter [Turicibacter sanguinis]MCU7196474.1 sodium/glutamate symporter [Turicibacter sanguinis]
MELNLNLYETMALVSIIFYLGKYIRKKFSILSKYCIPPSVVGGFIFSLVTLFLYQTNLAAINLDTSLQNLFMTTFFTSIGFTASFALLKQGGKKVITFLLLAILLVILQNIVGVSLATAFRLSPLLGLATGSIPMVGGHGTAGSFGPILEGLGVERATTVSVASATFGLIMGSILGGLVARNLILKHHLKAEKSNQKPEEAGGFNEENTNILSLKHMMNGACLLFIAMGLGSIVSKFIQMTSLTFPSYIGAMLVAALIRNIADLRGKELVEKEIETIGSLSLSFFLTMALMGLKLWQLFDLALPLIIMLIAQSILIALFASFITYKVMGKNYEAAVFASATCGFGMGATPNAIANMDELTNRFGFTPTPYFVVPLVGGLFIDFINSGIITIFINLFS